MKTKILLIILMLSSRVYSPAQGTWTQKADFGGAARGSSVGFSIGAKGYIVSGGNGNTVYKDFWEWDQLTNVWTQKVDFGGMPRWGATGFAIGSKGYVVTGKDSTSAAFSFLKDCWVYDTLTNSWAQKSDFPGNMRIVHIGFSIGTNGYFGTGIDNTGTLLKDFWEYNSLNDTWTQKADFGGTPRRFSCGFSIGSKGFIGLGNDGSYKKDFWTYNLASNSWTQMPDFPGASRDDAVAFSINSSGYVGIGWRELAFIQYKDFWKYDTLTNAWSAIQDFPGSNRFYSVGLSIGGKGYVGIGRDTVSNYTQSFWEYCPECITSINEIKNLSLTIYPNPASDEVTVTLNIAQSKSYILTISDITGRKIKEIPFAQELKIKTADIESGIYFLSLHKNSRDIVAIEKLVIAR